jgi:hypothetical protein
VNDAAILAACGLTLNFHGSPALVWTIGMGGERSGDDVWVLGSQQFLSSSQLRSNSCCLRRLLRQPLWLWFFRLLCKD